MAGTPAGTPYGSQMVHRADAPGARLAVASHLSRVRPSSSRRAHGAACSRSGPKIPRLRSGRRRALQRFAASRRKLDRVEECRAVSIVLGGHHDDGASGGRKRGHGPTVRHDRLVRFAWLRARYRRCMTKSGRSSRSPLRACRSRGHPPPERSASVESPRAFRCGYTRCSGGGQRPTPARRTATRRV